MRSYHADPGAGIEGLTLREHETPTPGPRQVVVRVHANSLSARELMVLRGDYVLPVKRDVVPVSDAAGEVVEIGEGVSRVAPGDSVAATLFPSWIDGPFGLDVAAQLGASLDGTLAELVVLDENGLVEIPDALSFEEAATLPCAAVTAWNALTGGRGVLAGETVLTLGSGGVSLFAIQFAKHLGARVIATTSSDEKANRLHSLGADEVIDYRETPDWHDAVREFTGGTGAELVVDVAGALERSLKSVAMYGEVAYVGLLSEEATSHLDPRTLFYACATVRTVAVGSRAQFEAMNRAIEANWIKPIVDRVFPFNDAAGAYRYYESKQPFGKVVIGPGGRSGNDSRAEESAATFEEEEDQ